MNFKFQAMNINPENLMLNKHAVKLQWCSTYAKLDNNNRIACIFIYISIFLSFFILFLAVFLELIKLFDHNITLSYFLCQ